MLCALTQLAHPDQHLSQEDRQEGKRQMRLVLGEHNKGHTRNSQPPRTGLPSIRAGEGRVRVRNRQKHPTRSQKPIRIGRRDKSAAQLPACDQEIQTIVRPTQT